jgi:hypothetical protein
MKHDLVNKWRVSHQCCKESDLKQLKQMSEKFQAKYGWLVPLARMLWWMGVYFHAGVVLLKGFLP